MKKALMVTMLGCLIVSCSIRKNKNNSYPNHEKTMNYPALTREFEEFETSTFVAHKTDVSTAGDDTIYHHSDQNSYIERDSKGKVLKSFSRPFNGDGTISGYDYSLNPIFGIYKKFYPSGNIMEKGVFSRFGFKVGNWFYYDYKGLLTSIIDNDLCYKFNTEDVLNYCKMNGIGLEKVDSGHQTSIYKSKSLDGKCIWIIRYPRFDILYYITIQLDANDGSLIKTDQTPFPNEE